MHVLERPEVDDEDDVAPEVSEHLGDHGEGSFKGFGEAILVLVDDEERVHFFHLKSISPMFYEQLLHAQTPKAQKSCLT